MRSLLSPRGLQTCPKRCWSGQRPCRDHHAASAARLHRRGRFRILADGVISAGSGVVELIASVLALRNGQLPRILNYDSPDPNCPLATVSNDSTSPGQSFLNLSVTPQGQAAVVCVAAVD